MKKMEKIVSIIIIAIMITIALGNFATVFAKVTGGDANFNPEAVGGDWNSNVGDIGNSIVGIIRTIGSLAAVAILVVLGVKYMMGSAEEKAEYKKTMLPYLLGAVMVFAASQLTGIIFDFATDSTLFDNPRN